MRLREEPLAFHPAKVILAATRMAGEKQHVLAAEREEVGHRAVFVLVRPAPLRLIERSHVLPLRQILRLEKIHGVAQVLGLHTRVFQVSSQQLYVPRYRVVGTVLDPSTGIKNVVHSVAAFALLGRFDHRIARVLFPTDEQVVPAGGETRAVRHTVVDERRHALLVDEGASAETSVPVRTTRSRRERDGVMHPVHQIRA